MQTSAELEKNLFSKQISFDSIGNLQCLCIFRAFCSYIIDNIYFIFIPLPTGLLLQPVSTEQDEGMIHPAAISVL